MSPKIQQRTQFFLPDIFCYDVLHTIISVQHCNNKKYSRNPGFLSSIGSIEKDCFAS